MKFDRSIGAAPYLLGVVAVLAAVAGGVYLSYWQSLRELERRADGIASEVLARTEAISEQYRQAFKPLLAQADPEPCSTANIARMRRQAVGARTLRGIGYVQENRLLCSSYGHHGEGIALGPPTYVSRIGSRIRTTVTLPFAGTETYVMVAPQDSGYCFFFLPDEAVDLVNHDPDIDIGILGSTSQRPMLSRGSGGIPAAASGGTFGKSDTLSLRDAGRLVVMKRSTRFDYTSYAAIPLAQMSQDWRRYAMVLLPLTLIAGFAIAALIVVNAMRRQTMPNQLRLALRRNELFLNYQPLVDLQSGRWVGAEALVRWRRSDGALVSPDLFIPMAERNDLIGQVTQKVIELFVRDATELLRRHADFDISLNFSSADLSDPATVAALRSRLQGAGIPAGQVIVEITERALVQPDEVQQQIRALRDMGVGIAIDDFGTGYSGLSYLTRLELDILKIDKAFVDTIGTDAATRSVVDHIIEIARSLDLVMVAEGVETQAQADYLRQRGVQYAQGWLYARAMSMDQLILGLESQEPLSKTD